MPSSADRAGAVRARSPQVVLEGWNRRLHYYLGLFFLFFIWLFSLTGLLLNHPRWALHDADRRAESRYERTVDVPAGVPVAEQARSVMRQLGMQGEPDWPAATPAGRLDFNVSRPSDSSQVRIDLAAGKAEVQHFDNTGFAAFRIFHTFNGSRYNAPSSRREWIWTSIWAVLMDAFAVALVAMVVGSYYMWYRLKRDHALGIAALFGGGVCCGMFLVGLFA